MAALLFAVLCKKETTILGDGLGDEFVETQQWPDLASSGDITALIALSDKKGMEDRTDELMIADDSMGDEDEGEDDRESASDKAKPQA